MSSLIHLFLGTILHQHQHWHLDHDYGSRDHHIPWEDWTFPNDHHVATTVYKLLDPLWEHDNRIPKMCLDVCVCRVPSGLVTQCTSTGWKIPSTQTSFLELSLTTRLAEVILLPNLGCSMVGYFIHFPSWASIFRISNQNLWKYMFPHGKIYL